MCLVVEDTRETEVYTEDGGWRVEANTTRTTGRQEETEGARKVCSDLPGGGSEGYVLPSPSGSPSPLRGGPVTSPGGVTSSHVAVGERDSVVDRFRPSVWTRKRSPDPFWSFVLTARYGDCLCPQREPRKSLSTDRT